MSSSRSQCNCTLNVVFVEMNPWHPAKRLFDTSNRICKHWTHRAADLVKYLRACCACMGGPCYMRPMEFIVVLRVPHGVVDFAEQYDIDKLSESTDDKQDFLEAILHELDPMSLILHDDAGAVVYVVRHAVCAHHLPNVHPTLLWKPRLALLDAAKMARLHQSVGKFRRRIVRESALADHCTSTTARRCHECYRSDDGVRACGRCGVARYCSRQCQTAAWSVHKKECEDFKYFNLHPDNRLFPVLV